jgi:hypothetical protein
MNSFRASFIKKMSKHSHLGWLNVIEGTNTFSMGEKIPCERIFFKWKKNRKRKNVYSYNENPTMHYKTIEFLKTSIFVGNPL